MQFAAKTGAGRTDLPERVEAGNADVVTEHTMNGVDLFLDTPPDDNLPAHAADHEHQAAPMPVPGNIRCATPAAISAPVTSLSVLACIMRR